DYNARVVRLLANITDDFSPFAPVKCRRHTDIRPERADTLCKHVEATGIVEPIGQRPADQTIHGVETEPAFHSNLNFRKRSAGVKTGFSHIRGLQISWRKSSSAD